MKAREFLEKFLEESALHRVAAAETSNAAPTAKEPVALPTLPEKPCPADARIVSLPEPGLLPDIEVNFLELIELRASVRQYADADLTQRDLSLLLWCTQGVKMALPSGLTRRNVPSAGACHPFETYLLLRRVEGLEPGVYRFLPLEHALYPIRTGTAVPDDFLPGFAAPAMAQSCAAVFLWAADFSRMAAKYGARASRYLFLDAGHVGQNLYLAAQALNLGACAVGAFYDEILNGVLGLDGKEEFVAYAATVGKPAR